MREPPGYDPQVICDDEPHAELSAEVEHAARLVGAVNDPGRGQPGREIEMIAFIVHALQKHMAELVDSKIGARRAEDIRTLLGVYSWPYALMPVGILCGHSVLYYADGAVVTRFRQLHIFGFRIARWITAIVVVPEAKKVAPTEPTETNANASAEPEPE